MLTWPQLWPRLRRINCNIVLQSFWLVLWWMLEACHYSLSDISDDITGGPLLHCYTVNSLSPAQCPSSPLTLITTAIIRTVMVSFLLRSVANPPDSQNLLAFSQLVTSCWASQHVESHMLIITCWAWACWVYFSKVERVLFLSLTVWKKWWLNGKQFFLRSPKMQETQLHRQLPS